MHSLIHVIWPWKFKKLLYANALERVRRRWKGEEKCLITMHPGNSHKRYSDAITQYFAIGAQIFLLSLCVARQLRTQNIATCNPPLLVSYSKLRSIVKSSNEKRGNENCTMVFMLFLCTRKKSIFRSAKMKKHYHEHYVSEFLLSALLSVHKFNC